MGLPVVKEVGIPPGRVLHAVSGSWARRALLQRTEAVALHVLGGGIPARRLGMRFDIGISVISVDHVFPVG